ncbi:MAG: transposase [Chitinophagales bacterium]|nr:transposase [Chitinophagales bacterium]
MTTDEGKAEVGGRGRYSRSSKQYIANRILKYNSTYSSLHKEIRESFGGSTSTASLYNWVQACNLLPASEDNTVMQVLHTDEKHPSKKRSNTQYVIASCGRADKASKSVALHANLSKSNDADAIEEHYKSLILNGLDPLKVLLVVTDMASIYATAVAKYFPNALHQHCVFHLIQQINKYLKVSLRKHRQEHLEEGNRKAAHQTSFLLLKGQEHLTSEEQEEVAIFCEEHPTVDAEYNLKEDIRGLYATVTSLPQAIAYKDMIVERYTEIISPEMTKALNCFVKNFEQSIAYIKTGFFLDKTNNDAERLMRNIKHTQQIHYFFRKSQNYINSIRVAFGLVTPIAV